jgi:hypothetical protein
MQCVFIQYNVQRKRRECHDRQTSPSRPKLLEATSGKPGTPATNLLGTLNYQSAQGIAASEHHLSPFTFHLSPLTSHF